MRDEEFEKLTTEEKLKWLHKEMIRVRSCVIDPLAFNELKQKVSKLEKNKL